MLVVGASSRRRAGLAAWLGKGTALPMVDKTHHVLERLPQHRRAIRERMMVDRDFRSLCEDYDDALEALRRWEASEDRNRQLRVEEFRNLVEELEQEIVRELGAG